MDQHLERRIRGCVKLLLIVVKRLFCIVERCKLRRQGGACRGHRLFDSRPSEYDEVSRGIQKLAPCCSEKKQNQNRTRPTVIFYPLNQYTCCIFTQSCLVLQFLPGRCKIIVVMVLQLAVCPWRRRLLKYMVVKCVQSVQSKPSAMLWPWSSSAPWTARLVCCSSSSCGELDSRRWLCVYRACLWSCVLGWTATPSCARQPWHTGIRLEL